MVLQTGLEPVRPVRGMGFLVLGVRLELTTSHFPLVSIYTFSIDRPHRFQRGLQVGQQLSHSSSPNKSQVSANSTTGAFKWPNY